MNPSHNAPATALPAPEAKQNFWWPRTNTQELAFKAAQNAAVAYGLIALGYVIASLWIVFTGRSLIYSHNGFPAITAGTDVVIAVIAAYLAWRSQKRPTLVLSVVALLWVLLEFAGKIAALQDAIIYHYWAQILATIAALGAVRGSLALRKLSPPSSPGSA